jgi:hypothetical protein
MATPQRRPEGLLPWVLDDAARTRRFCVLLALVLPALVLVAVSLAVVAFLSPLAGATLGGLLGVLSAPAAAAAYRRRRPGQSANINPERASRSRAADAPSTPSRPCGIG